ncbi:MAG: LTA synthase family protein [Betaproteobacteria bacterium]|nr:LTA synthase family protein [Betaproteobacteria bacterium]MCL2885683.1 LTA synthase family protein [Betaproteobacteria bacterium]
MPFFRHGQVRYLGLIAACWLAIFFLTRSALLFANLPETGAGVFAVLRLYALGAVYDLAFLLYALLPLAFYLALCPQRLWQSRAHRAFLVALTGISLFAMLFVAAAEWLFWDEFGVRFNFIAVDYLVYSKEVVDNIMESYPIYPLLTLLAVLAAIATLALRRPLAAALAAPALPGAARWRLAALLLLAALLDMAAIGQDFPRPQEGNRYQAELAGNGPFQFFAAFRNNELDYRQLYATLPESEAATLLRAEVAEPNARFIGDAPFDIRRVIANRGPEQRRNIVLVTIESLSAKYLGSFGNDRGLTPNLDALRRESLFFTNFQATGTRTDRGLEAITLSIPPTPGRSIVKRIGRESGYASLGQQLAAKGYDCVFVYGGRGYFDNMNSFFAGNGYRIVDQSSVADDEMQFRNAWGMSDEDLYAQTLKIADQNHAAGQPFFLQLMTTSNHRPYTYPAGRIDIPSGSGRDGAVKYTDYAIGRFLEQARAKPWFADTVFFFVADHTAGSAGRENLPVANYHIPLFIYAPGWIAPREVTALTSQIDLAPTLLGLLGMDYVSTFFGRNALLDENRPGRTLIGNYQHLGLFDSRDLAILSPRQIVRRHDDALGESHELPASLTDPLIRRNIAYYEGASYAFRKGLLAWRPELQTAVRH